MFTACFSIFPQIVFIVYTKMAQIHETPSMNLKAELFFICIESLYPVTEHRDLRGDAHENKNRQH